MTRLRATIVALVALACLAIAPSAEAAFGVEPGSLHVEALNRDGTPDLLAGSHPYAFFVGFNTNHTAENFAEGSAKDVIALLPAGLIGNPTAVPRCPRSAFDSELANCPPETQIGVLGASFNGENETPIAAQTSGIYNLVPPPGVAASIGYGGSTFNAIENATLVRGGAGGYRIAVTTEHVTLAHLSAVEETVWGEPADPAHDAERECINPNGIHSTPCASIAPREPYLTLPTSCGGPLQSTVELDSTEEPGVFVGESEVSRNGAGEPEALGSCAAVPFFPGIAASPTTVLAENPSGLAFDLSLPNFGLEEAGGIAEAGPRKVEVTLPEGMTVNPSEAEGTGVCTEAQIELEGEASPTCPEAAKIGSVEVHTPLLEEPLEGSLYLEQPYQNKFGSLVALYMTFKDPERGVLVKLAGKVTPDPQTGQLTTTFEGLPQVPFSDFKLHFREGPRAPLVSPPACGTYTTEARLTPWSAQEPPAPGEVIAKTAVFKIEHGAEGGACPAAGNPPFHPGLLAGTTNNAAGTYSPFYLRLTRTDSEQEITHFSIKLPPGVTGKLAGVPYCPQSGIELAESRKEKPTGGQEELEHPSCPAASEIGHTLVGAGVGGALTYVLGKVYLAGPYHGSNLSIVSITAAEAGPFDLGTVVVRDGLKVDPESAEVSVDGQGSDPIPHIIAGIPVHLRDIRVYVDRPSFVLNPTSCARTSTASTVLGSGTDFASEADDRPVTVTSPFQAASCASLAFKPKLALSLKGPTKRAGLPSLKAVVAARPGDANIGRAVVTLPPSEFLEQGHIGTTCTRVQFNAGGGNGEQCPERSIYGHAVATTPLLSEPLEGPVFLRSNGGERQLPDLVAALHSADIDIDLVGYISSVHQKGSDVSRIRTTFAAIPDAPVSKFTLEMFGGKKGLLVNSTNLCKGTHRASSELTGQNGKRYDTEPAVGAQCGKKGKKGKKAKGGPRTLLVPFARGGW
jgi:hypothetical protein